MTTSGYMSVPPTAYTPEGIPYEDVKIPSYYASKSNGELPSRPLFQRKGVSSLYPLSLISVSLWIMFICATLVVLEKAVAAAPQSINQPWAYTVLPGLMLTVFAQAHVPITAMHLARTGVSALQSRSTAPKSWAELFWLSDHSWQGPVGVVTTIIGMSKLKVRLSTTFWVFSFTCVVALVTPLILSRTYPIVQIDVLTNLMITPSTVSPKAMLTVDGTTELGIGFGSWAAGLSVLDVYNRSIYLPEDISRDNATGDDFFFAGDIQGRDVTLPGIRLQGGCHPYPQADAVMNAPGANSTTFLDFCNRTLSTVGSSQLDISVTPWSFEINFSYCTDGGSSLSPFNSTSSQSATSAFLFFNNTNSTGAATFGVIKCQSLLSLGLASLSGTQGTYKTFSEDPFYNASAAEGGEPLMDPLFGVLVNLNQFKGSPNSADGSTLARQLGYTAAGIVNSDLNFIQPTLNNLGDQLWMGVSHMTAGIGLLSRASDIQYAAVEHHTTSGRIRSNGFAIATLSLLAAWLAALSYVSIRNYRLAFGSSLNSYVAARLFADEASLVQDEPSCDLSQNERLSRPFVWGIQN